MNVESARPGVATSLRCQWISLLEHLVVDIEAARTSIAVVAMAGSGSACECAVSVLQDNKDGGSGRFD